MPDYVPDHVPADAAGLRCILKDKELAANVLQYGIYFCIANIAVLSVFTSCSIVSTFAPHMFSYCSVA